MYRQSCISILLVDDHAIVREGYRSLLEKQPGLQVIAEAVDGEQAYELFKKYHGIRVTFIEKEIEILE